MELISKVTLLNLINKFWEGEFLFPIYLVRWSCLSRPFDAKNKVYSFLSNLQCRPTVVDLGRRRITQSLMETLLVVKLKIGPQARPTFVHVLV